MGFMDKYPYTDFNELNLDWILKKIKTLDNFFSKEFPELIERIKNDEYNIEKIQKWINDFDIYLLQDALAKYFKVAIFVEISEAGYIIYNIPETWDEITFNTTGLDIDITGIEYGHLTLSY